MDKESSGCGSQQQCSQDAQYPKGPVGDCVRARPSGTRCFAQRPCRGAAGEAGCASAQLSEAAFAHHRGSTHSREPKHGFDEKSRARLTSPQAHDTSRRPTRHQPRVVTRAQPLDCVHLQDGRTQRTPTRRSTTRLTTCHQPPRWRPAQPGEPWSASTSSETATCPAHHRPTRPRGPNHNRDRPRPRRRNLPPVDPWPSPSTAPSHISPIRRPAQAAETDNLEQPPQQRGPAPNVSLKRLRSTPWHGRRAGAEELGRVVERGARSEAGGGRSAGLAFMRCWASRLPGQDVYSEERSGRSQSRAINNWCRSVEAGGPSDAGLPAVSVGRPQRTQVANRLV